MRRMVCVTGLMALLAASFALARAQPHTSTAMSAATSGFISTFSMRNLFAMEGARLAATRTRNAEVRKIAQTLLQDHARMAEQLDRLTSENRLGTPEDEISAPQQIRLEALRQTEPASFDRAYVELQYAAHAETIDLAERYARKGDNRALKRFAQGVQPTLRRHMDLMRPLQ
jgi:putative membrane protein